MAALTENLKADLVIIGGGGSGLASALSATENGCKNIVVLEKAGTCAGTSAMAHDVFGAESPVQKRMGVDAPRDLLFKEAMEWAHWSKVDPWLVRALVDKSGETIGWLEGKGIKFELLPFYTNQVPLVRHAVEGHGAQIMKVLRKECEEAGISMFTRTRGKKILRGSQGNVTGVVATTKDGEFTVETKSVCVTAGGYGANKEMLKKYCSGYYNYDPDVIDYTGLPSNTGDGIIMGEEAGCATQGLGTLVLHGPFLHFKRSPGFTLKDALAPDRLRMSGQKVFMNLTFVAREPQTMWVNKRGRRFLDEGFDLGFFAQGNAFAQQPGCVGFTLFDSENLRIMEEEGLIRPGAAVYASWLPMQAATPLPGLTKGVQEEAEKVPEWIRISDSWDEIADFIGADPAVLKAQIDEYNTDCDRGHDSLFAKDKRYMIPLRTPPYYAIKGPADIAEALGGIKINEKMEAIDTEGNVIPGLYAAGANAGCWETESYCFRLSGHLVGWALNSGRIAGESIAKYLAK